MKPRLSHSEARRITAPLRSSHAQSVTAWNAAHPVEPTKDYYQEQRFTTTVRKSRYDDAQLVTDAHKSKKHEIELRERVKLVFVRAYDSYELGEPCLNVDWITKK